MACIGGPHAEAHAAAFDSSSAAVVNYFRHYDGSTVVGPRRFPVGVRRMKSVVSLRLGQNSSQLLCHGLTDHPLQDPGFRNSIVLDSFINA